MIELVELCKEMVRLHQTGKEWSAKTSFSVVIVRKLDLVFLQRQKAACVMDRSCVMDREVKAACVMDREVVVQLQRTVDICEN